MLRSLKELERYTVPATDGEIGNVVSFLLHDEHWIVRYLVHISPIFFRQADWSTQRFHLALTMDKVKNRPSIDSESHPGRPGGDRSMRPTDENLQRGF